MKLTVENVLLLQEKSLAHFEAQIGNYLFDARKTASKIFSKAVLGTRANETLNKAEFGSALEYSVERGVHFFLLKFKIDDFSFIFNGKLKVNFPASQNNEFSYYTHVYYIGVTWENELNYFDLYNTYLLYNGLHTVILNYPTHAQKSYKTIIDTFYSHFSKDETKVSSVEMLWKGII